MIISKRKNLINVLNLEELEVLLGIKLKESLKMKIHVESVEIKLTRTIPEGKISTFLSFSPKIVFIL